MFFHPWPLVCTCVCVCRWMSISSAHTRTSHSQLSNAQVNVSITKWASEWWKKKVDETLGFRVENEFFFSFGHLKLYVFRTFNQFNQSPSNKRSKVRPGEEEEEDGRWKKKKSKQYHQDYFYKNIHCLWVNNQIIGDKRQFLIIVFCTCVCAGWLAGWVCGSVCVPKTNWVWLLRMIWVNTLSV